jgi:hypothetical protein
MGTAITLLGLLLAFGGVWYARRQVYNNHQYVTWRSATFRFVKDSPLDLELPAEFARAVGIAENPAIVDVSLELLAASELIAVAGKSASAERALRIRCGDAVKVLGVIVESTGGFDDLSISRTADSLDIESSRVRPHHPAILSVLVDGMPELTLATTWQNTKVWQYQSTVLPQKYRSKVIRSTIRSLWPTEPPQTTSPKQQRRATEPATVRDALKALWAFAKFCVRLIVVGYVGLSIYADLRDISVRVAAEEIEALFRSQEELIGNIFGAIFGTFCCLGLPAMFILASVPGWRKLLPTPVPRDQDIRLTVETFMHSPGSWRRLEKALKNATAHRTRQIAIKARESRLRSDLT